MFVLTFCVFFRFFHKVVGRDALIPPLTLTVVFGGLKASRPTFFIGLIYSTKKVHSVNCAPLLFIHF
jgi:hypothetical protein